MKPLTCTAAMIFALSAVSAAFAQSPTRAPQTRDDCMTMDYNCNTQAKGVGNTPAIESSDRNAARLRDELRTPAPQISTEPEEPEQPIHSTLEPEAPIR
jgi:hypothetical protein